MSFRWTVTAGDAGTQNPDLEPYLRGLKADDRDQALTLWTQAKVERTMRAIRRREAQSRAVIVACCWGIITLAALALAVALWSNLENRPQAPTYVSAEAHLRCLKCGVSVLKASGDPTGSGMCKKCRGAR